MTPQTSYQEELESEMATFCERVEMYSGELDLSMSGRQGCQQKNEDKLKQLRESGLPLFLQWQDFLLFEPAVKKLS
nr:hypothetical protein BaRGS_030861 [Batillaria attramentaria]